MLEMVFELALYPHLSTINAPINCKNCENWLHSFFQNYSKDILLLWTVSKQSQASFSYNCLNVFQYILPQLTFFIYFTYDYNVIQIKTLNVKEDRSCAEHCTTASVTRCWNKSSQNYSKVCLKVATAVFV